MDVVASVRWGQMDFTLELHKAIVKGKESENVVLSPLSITMALTMVAAGAQGPTLAQIADCVRIPEGELMRAFAAHIRTTLLGDATVPGGPLVALANRAWVDKSVTLKPQFQKVLKESYGSEAAAVDFISKAGEASKNVNEWAAKETHGKINDLLPRGSVDSDTRLVVANALYFKGDWQKAFDPYHTRDEDFHLLDGRVVKVATMHASGKRFVKSFASFKALRLPYKPNGKFAMFVLLPHEMKGLAALEASLTAKALSEDLKQVTEAVTMEKFALPKFMVSCGFDAPDALKALGLELLFDQDKADLTEMVESPADGRTLYVSNMYHKTFVDVNEAGTEAAAATAAVISSRSWEEPVNPQEFVCDHPFLFVITEETSDVIVFTGRITNPSHIDV